MNESGVVILGVGAARLRDAGLGLVAARVLQQERLPAGVRVVEAEGGPLTLVHHLEDCARAIIITAADMDAPPGTVRVLTPEAAETDLLPLAGVRRQMTVPDALELAGLAGALPDVHIIAVQPLEVMPGTGLSVVAGAAIPDVVQTVRGLLETPQGDP